MKERKFSIFMFLLFFFLFAIFTGNKLLEADKEENITRDLYNFTDAKLNLSDKVNLTTPTYVNESIMIYRVRTIMYKTVEYVVFVIQEVVKVGVQIGYENGWGDANALIKTLIYLLVISLVASVIPFLFGVVIVLHYGVKYVKRKITNFKNKKGSDTQ